MTLFSPYRSAYPISWINLPLHMGEYQSHDHFVTE